MSTIRASTTPEKFAWQAPEDYLKQHKAERWSVKSIVWRFVTGSILERLLWDYAKRLWDEHQHELAALIVIAMVALVAILAAMEPVPKVTVGGKIAISRVKVFADRVAVPWTSILWFRIVPAEGFSAYRALELEAERSLSRTTLLRLVFDPGQVDESQLLEFLNEVAPTKRWQH